MAGAKAPAFFLSSLHRYAFFVRDLSSTAPREDLRPDPPLDTRAATMVASVGGRNSLGHRFVLT
jgi:hypothetical protein